MQKSTPEMDQEEAGKVKQKVMSALGPEKNNRKAEELQEMLDEESQKPSPPEEVSQVDAKESLEHSRVFLQLAEGAKDEVSLDTCIKYAQVHALQAIAQSLINYLEPPF